MNTEELNALKNRAQKIAVEHGFYKDVKPDAFYLGLIMSEAGEAINADRKGLHADTVGFIHYMDATKFYFRKAFDSYIKDSVEDEIGDIVIWLLDFAGLKEYELVITQKDHDVATHVLSVFEKYKLPGVLFSLIGGLSDAFDEDFPEACIGTVICVLSDCFEKITGSDKDLWWFVEQKMRYNELRPMLNGKKY